MDTLTDVLVAHFQLASLVSLALALVFCFWRAIER